MNNSSAPTLPPSSRADDSRSVSSPVAPADLPIIAPVIGAEAIVVLAILLALLSNVDAIVGVLS